MLRITINSYLIVPFLSNLLNPKILRIIFSYLIKNGLVLLGRRTIFTNMQNPVTHDRKLLDVDYYWMKIIPCLRYQDPYDYKFFKYLN